MTGVELIAQERQRQVQEEEWTAEHDALHTELVELVWAGMAYALAGVVRINGRPVPKSPPDGWPWYSYWWKPSDDPIKNFVKAGALIAAEIDRLQSVHIPMAKNIQIKEG